MRGLIYGVGFVLYKLPAWVQYALVMAAMVWLA